MTHLRIEQGSTVETVSDSIIKKLYDVALSISEPQGGEGDDAYIAGHISVPHTYESYVEYLAGSIGEGTSGVVTNLRQNSDGRFQDLRIDITNDYYVPFTDQVFKGILAAACGKTASDNLIKSDLASITGTSIYSQFLDNTNLVDATEFKYLTNIATYPTSSQSGTFKGCTNLERIELPDQITKLSTFPYFNNTTGMFRGCSSLEYVKLPTNLEEINMASFMGCSSLEEIDMSNTNCTRIYQLAFSLCSSLLNITLPLACTRLGDGAFVNCTNLKFSNSDLNNIVIIDGSRDNWLFCYHSNWNAKTNITSTDLYLPNLEYLGFGAFAGQSLILTINLPGLTTLHCGATFAYCTSLQEVKSLGNITILDHNDTTYGDRGGIFAGCTNLQKVALPVTLTEISNSMFENCSSLSCIYRDSNKYMYRCISSSDAGQNVIAVMLDITPTTEQLSLLWWTQKSGTFNIGSYYTAAEVGNGFVRFGNAIGTSEIDQLNENDILSITDSHSTNTITYFKKVCQITKDSFLSITMIGGAAFKKADGLTNKALYFPNVTKMNAQTVFANNARAHVYLPGDIQFKGRAAGNIDFVDSRTGYDWGPVSGFAYKNRDAVPWGYSKLKTLYFKDTNAFPAGFFYGADIDTVILNNTTVPTLLSSPRESDLLPWISDLNTNFFAGAYEYPTGTIKIGNIYVPDSAVSDYLASSLFSTVVSKIKPLSQCPRITVVEAENGADGLIEEYMS